MMIKVKLLMFAGMILLLTASGIFAQEDAQRAIIRELAGTVELQQQGSAVWEKAVQGQTVTPDTIISTGFKSNAVISIGDSRISVRPLTRLSITEISARAGTETINVSLQAGRVRVDVNQPARTGSSFNVISPVATASVRGTVFEMDVFELRVIEGTVEYLGGSDAPVLIDAVGYSYVNEKTGRAVYPMVTLNSDINPALPIGNDSFNSFEVSTIQSKNNPEVVIKIGYGK